MVTFISYSIRTGEPYNTIAEFASPVIGDPYSGPHLYIVLVVLLAQVREWP